MLVIHFIKLKYRLKCFWHGGPLGIKRGVFGDDFFKRKFTSHRGIFYVYIILSTKSMKPLCAYFFRINYISHFYLFIWFFHIFSDFIPHPDGSEFGVLISTTTRSTGPQNFQNLPSQAYFFQGIGWNFLHNSCSRSH